MNNKIIDLARQILHDYNEDWKNAILGPFKELEGASWQMNIWQFIISNGTHYTKGLTELELAELFRQLTEFTTVDEDLEKELDTMIDKCEPQEIEADPDPNWFNKIIEEAERRIDDDD